MEPLDVDRADAWDDLARDLLDDVPTFAEPSDGDLVPPLPPEEGRGEGPRTPRPHPHDHEIFSPLLLLAWMVVVGGSTALQLYAMSGGAQGGIVGAGLLSFGLITLFVVPLLVGSVWFGSRREQR